MKVEDIVKSVRLCIDEEADNGSSLADAGLNDESKMDSIIKDKIGDALRWVCLFAPADMLGGSDEVETGTTTEVPTGVLVDVTSDDTGFDIDQIDDYDAGVITLDSNFIKLARVRVEGWHRAVRVPISEDSDEYLQLYDSNGATATADRPQAALIEKSQRQLEVWPWEDTKSVCLTYVANCEPKAITTGSGTSLEITAYALPPRARTAIIYYLAFLLCSAYGDARAARMLEIARMSLGTADRIA